MKRYQICLRTLIRTECILEKETGKCREMWPEGDGNIGDEKLKKGVGSGIARKYYALVCGVNEKEQNGTRQLVTLSCFMINSTQPICKQGAEIKDSSTLILKSGKQRTCPTLTHSLVIDSWSTQHV